MEEEEYLLDVLLIFIWVIFEGELFESFADLFVSGLSGDAE